MNEDSSCEDTRRELLAKMGTGLVAITMGSALGQISPEQARASKLSLRRLSAQEGRTLEALGDVLLPGAAAAGMAHYVDSQLGSEAPLLILRYLDYPTPPLEFYQRGLRSIESLALTRHSRSFHELDSGQGLGLVREISRGNPPGWDGPPAPLFYFVTRSDAVDVYYGTQEGFARLKIPYMAHIQPPRKW